MSTSRHIGKICAVAAALSLALTVLFMNGKAFGIVPASRQMGYESRLFDTSVVHTMDIVMEDWDGFLESCEKEQYSPCTVVIDGESYKNIGIRGKGNTSLSSVRDMGSQRYSFKLEFDQYESGKTYYGLDKLSLNNLIQDNTMMKDYIVYRMMGDFGVDAPLCSYVFITVNGQAWGLYLAVEGVEDGFLERCYGSDSGELYKPDSLSFGGGRGNGREFDPGGFGGAGSADVKLQYIDDDPDSYQNIFDHAKTEITEADKGRLIAALKNVSAYEELEKTVDTDEVMRYFVVHNFVCNEDSYTGVMIHNYYLYEKDGRLSMIPWDYNLAFGTFQNDDAESALNTSIDSPVFGGTTDDRPMLGWIFSDESYVNKYHALFASLIDRWFANGALEQMIEETRALLAPYVESDPTKFCTAEAFETGVQTLKQFTTLRAEAVRRQLAGDTSPVDAGGLRTSDMGSMGDFAGPGGRPGTDDTGRTPENLPENLPDNTPRREDAQDWQNGPVPPGFDRNGENAGENGAGFPEAPPDGGSAWDSVGAQTGTENDQNTAGGLLVASVLILLMGLWAAARWGRRN